MQISSIVYLCASLECAITLTKWQNSEDLKILFENSSLHKHRLSIHVTSGVFKEDKIEQQLLLFWFFWMLTILGVFSSNSLNSPLPWVSSNFF